MYLVLKKIFKQFGKLTGHFHKLLNLVFSMYIHSTINITLWFTFAFCRYRNDSCIYCNKISTCIILVIQISLD